MSNLYFTGAVSQVPLAFTGDAGANQIIVTGTVAAAGPQGATGATGATGPAGTTDHLLLSNIGTNTHAQIDTALTRLANTSGTNTGDETLATIKSKLGVTTLSGSNTGDQDLSSYATSSALTTGLATKANTSHTHAESEVTGLVSDLAAKSPALNPTAVKTANYTAAANDFVPVDTTSGAVTITLPSAPANGTRFGAKIVTLGTGNLVTITRGGTDVFNKAGGNTSVTVTLLNQSVQFQYSSGIWYGVAADIGLTALDARYQAVGSYAPATGIAESAVTNLTTDLAAKAPALNPTTVKTTNYTASANEFVPVDTTSGNVIITLPTAPVTGTRFGAKMVTQGGTNTVTITAGGTDVFNKTGGSTSVTLSLSLQSIQFQYSGGIWYGVAGDIGVTALDNRYQAKLVSGSNIKTVNGTSLLGSGDVTISGGSGSTNNFNTRYTDHANLTGSGLTALTGAVNGSNTAFTVSQGVYVAGSLTVFKNGVLQVLGDAITQTTPASGIFNFVTAPATGDQIQVSYTTSTTTTSTYVQAPASSTNTALARYNGTTGAVVKDSTTTMDDSGNVSWQGRQDYTSTNYDITNPVMRFTQADSSATDSHAKGLLLEWGGNMTSGVNYPYGIATQAYANNGGPGATFTVPTSGYKKWGWIMTHYQSPISTGETVHQHLNLETVKADYTTVITRLQVSFGEDIALVSFPNSNVKVLNDLNFQVGTDAAGAFIKHDTTAAQIVVTSPANTSWNYKDVYNQFNSTSAGSTAIQAGLISETTKRFSMNTSGKMDWGTGSATRDVNLYRTAAATVGTDNNFSVGGSLTVGSLAVYGTVKSALARISGGAQQWGIPGATFNSSGTSALNANEVRYVPFTVPYPITLSNQQFEVTTGPAGAANVRIAIYAADTDLQPTGSVLYDSGSIAVANAFAGVKTTAMSLALTPGQYLVAINCDVSMSLRTLSSPTPMLGSGMGATPLIQRVSVAQTYGALPSPGTKWTATSASSGGLQNSVIFQWT